MKKELKETLRHVQRQIAEATEGHEWDEQAEFFGALADWCYGRHEMLLSPAELELQDYERDE